MPMCLGRKRTKKQRKTAALGGGSSMPRSSQTLEAGFRGGARELTSHNPRCFRIFSMTARSSIKAMTRIVPPHFGHRRGSTSYFFWMSRGNFSIKGGTRPPSPREVNSRGSSPAVGRFAPSGALSCLPRIIEMIRFFVLFLPKHIGIDPPRRI